jgi:hypothetical protein
VRAGGEFESREAILRSHVTRAVAVVVDAEHERSTAWRGTTASTEDRILVMPFSPSPPCASPSARPTVEVLERYDLQPGYLFYPAQFWPHKNHVRLLEAIALRRKAGR